MSEIPVTAPAEINHSCMVNLNSLRSIHGPIMKKGLAESEKYNAEVDADYSRCIEI